MTKRTVDLLVNGDFSDGWVNFLPYGTLTNQQPYGFGLTIRRPGALLLSFDADIPDDKPRLNIIESVPECVHKHNLQLPPEERVGGSRPLVLAGAYTYKIFVAHNPFSVILEQPVSIPFGGLLRVEVPVQVHQHGDGSPGAAVWMVDIGDWRSGWKTFGHGFEDRQWVRIGRELKVERGDIIDIVLYMESRSEAGIDFWTDRWRALFEYDEPQCRGMPREQYERVYNVIPQDATEEEAVRIFRIAWERGRQTVGGSSDDAGIGDLDKKIAVEWNRIEPSQYVDFYMQNYPGTKVEFESLEPPEPEPEPEPEPPEPEPEPPSPGFDSIPKAVAAGLHFTAGPPGKGEPDGPFWLPDTTREYIRNGKPSLVKAVSGGDVYRMGRFAAEYSPGTRTIWRRVVTDGGYITGNLRMQAQRLLDGYKAEAEVAGRNLGIGIDEFWHKIAFIGGLNELIGNWSPIAETVVEFECNFADLVDEQLPGVKATLLALPVGNPSHDEIDIVRLLPAADISAEHGHVLDYHAYWTAGPAPNNSYLDQEWEWFAGRWTKMDEVFRDYGVSPFWLFGESGMVFDPTGGQWVGSGLSWKAAGSIEYYLHQIARMNERVRAWNATHNNRCLGGVLFTCEYSWGWDEFLLRDGDLRVILDWMKGL